MFKEGDVINYGFWKNVKIVGEDEKHYILQDCKEHKKKVYKELVEENAKLIKSPKTIYEMTIVVDTNDADFDTNIGKISEKELDKFRPLIAAIKKFKPYKTKGYGSGNKHHHNWPKGECLREDLGEKSPAEIYSKFSEELIEEFEEEWLPCGSDYGFHTIESIEICPYVKKERLL